MPAGRPLAGIYDAASPAEPRQIERTLGGTWGGIPTAHYKYRALALAVAGSQNGRVGPRETICVLDGHVFDLDRLASELRVPSDLEPESLLALAYEHRGERLLDGLRGEFALLLYSTDADHGLIARDQVGVKSLYYRHSGPRLVFASEARDLLAMLPSRPAPNASAVVQFLVERGTVGETFYEGVRELEPGHYLRLEAGEMAKRRYWTPSYGPILRGTREELAGEVRGELERAIGRRVATNGTTGVQMSGGLDSATVAALAETIAPGRVGTYSGVFPREPGADEKDLIDRLCAELGLPSVRIEADAQGLLHSILGYLDRWQLPLGSFGEFWQEPLHQRAAGDGIAVMLSGDGGDEVFGARWYLLADRLRHARPLAAYRLARRLPGAGTHPPLRPLLGYMREFGLRAAVPYRLHEAIRRRRGHGGRPPDWFTEQSVRALDATYKPWEWKRLEGPRWWAYHTWLLTSFLSSAGLLGEVRRRGADAGVEARFPLLDLDLIELSQRLAPEAGFDPHLDRPVLRESVAGVVPDFLRLSSDKTRFDQFVFDAIMADLPAIEGLIGGPDAEVGAYVKRELMSDEVLKTPAEHQPRPSAWSGWLLRLVTVECWLRSQRDSAFPARFLEDGQLVRPSHNWSFSQSSFYQS